jgi:hypothetical protein
MQLEDNMCINLAVLIIGAVIIVGIGWVIGFGSGIKTTRDEVKRMQQLKHDELVDNPDMLCRLPKTIMRLLSYDATLGNDSAAKEAVCWYLVSYYAVESKIDMEEANQKMEGA